MRVGLRILLSAVIFEAEKETASTRVAVPVHSPSGVDLPRHTVCVQLTLQRSNLLKNGMAVHATYSTSQEAKAKILLQVQGQTDLPSQF